MSDDKFPEPILVQGYKSPINNLIYGSRDEYFAHMNEEKTKLMLEQGRLEVEAASVHKEQMQALIDAPRLNAVTPRHLTELLTNAFREIVALSPKLPAEDRLFPDEWFPKLREITFEGSWTHAPASVLTPIIEKRRTPSDLYFTGDAILDCDDDFDVDVFRQVFPYIGFTNGSKSRYLSGGVAVRCEGCFALDDFPLMYAKFDELSQVAERAMQFDEQLDADIKTRIKEDPECKTMSQLLRELLAERERIEQQVKAVSEQIRFAEQDVHARCDLIKKNMAEDYPNPHLKEYKELDSTLKFGELGPYVKIEQRT
jgi:hypothetical protein